MFLFFELMFFLEKKGFFDGLKGKNQELVFSG
jgi:hypothetical protein